MKVSGRFSQILVVLILSPVAVFAVYVSWLVVPKVVEIVVPAVVRAVLGA